VRWAQSAYAPSPPSPLQIPVSALPDELLALLRHMPGTPHASAASYGVGDVVLTIDEDAPSVASAAPVGAAVAISDLPLLWQIVLKLQLGLQVGQGRGGGVGSE